MGRSTSMDQEAADRISGGASRELGSDTAQSGLSDLAQAAADRNHDDYDSTYDGGFVDD